MNKYRLMFRRIALSMLVLVSLIGLLAFQSEKVSADPGNGLPSYTMPSACGGGTLTITILNDHAAASFSGMNVGIMKAFSVSFDGGETWIPVVSVPGNGVYKRTTVCTWEEGGVLFTSEVLIPHD